MRTMQAVAMVLAGVAASLTTLAAQDPLSVLPEAYRLVYENAWVKVVRVRYAPREVLRPHLHNALAAAYVYLNEGGPIVFRHHDLPYGGVTRPPTRAGSFRLYKGLKEVHSVENPTDTPSEFLRVEFKTEPVDEGSLKGRFFADERPATASVARVQFDNAQVRVSRIIAISGSPAAIAPEWPALIVALAPGVVASRGPQPPGPPRLVDTGDAVWLEPFQPATIGTTGTRAAEMLRFEFKTSPMPATERP